MLTRFVGSTTDANLEIVQYNSIATVTLYFLRSKNILETNSRIENTEYIVTLYLKLNYGRNVRKYGIQYNLNVMSMVDKNIIGLYSLPQRPPAVLTS
jgi:hypothetical protein